MWSLLGIARARIWLLPHHRCFLCIMHKASRPDCTSVHHVFSQAVSFQIENPAFIFIGRPPLGCGADFKVLIMCSLYNLSDDAVEYQLRDRLSFIRFLGLGRTQQATDRTGEAGQPHPLGQAGAGCPRAAQHRLHHAPLRPARKGPRGIRLKRIRGAMRPPPHNIDPKSRSNHPNKP